MVEVNMKGKARKLLEGNIQDYVLYFRGGQGF